jgi:hypothetical protein
MLYVSTSCNSAVSIEKIGQSFPDFLLSWRRTPVVLGGRFNLHSIEGACLVFGGDDIGEGAQASIDE